MLPPCRPPLIPSQVSTECAAFGTRLWGQNPRPRPISPFRPSTTPLHHRVHHIDLTLCTLTMPPAINFHHEPIPAFGFWLSGLKSPPPPDLAICHFQFSTTTFPSYNRSLSHGWSFPPCRRYQALVLDIRFQLFYLHLFVCLLNACSHYLRYISYSTLITHPDHTPPPDMLVYALEKCYIYFLINILELDFQYAEPIVPPICISNLLYPFWQKRSAKSNAEDSLRAQEESVSQL